MRHHPQIAPCAPSGRAADAMEPHEPVAGPSRGRRAALQLAPLQIPSPARADGPAQPPPSLLSPIASVGTGRLSPTRSHVRKLSDALLPGSGSSSTGISSATRKSSREPPTTAFGRGRFECRKLLSLLLESADKVLKRARWFGEDASYDPEDDRRDGERPLVEELVGLIVQIRDVLFFAEQQKWTLLESQCVHASAVELTAQ